MSPFGETMTDLTKFQKPARYTGGEYGACEMKENASNFCMCFPDVYEVGMSNLGTRILYYALNETDYANCERCYSPWVDYGDYLKQQQEPLCSLERHKPLKEFDAIGFSLQYELSYSNVLYMLDLAGIPLEAAERGEDFPIVAAGGPCAVNPEPLADFIDVFLIGEGETSLKEFMQVLHERKGAEKSEILKELAKIEGAYVPSVFQASDKVLRRWERNLDQTFFPHCAIVPNIEIVHDRAIAELYRGCANGCRFCQAGFIYRPVRNRSVESLEKISTDLLRFTGYDELSLNSLSTGDYPWLGELIERLQPLVDERGVKLALPSLRLDSYSKDWLQSERKGSLTFAPEAGTQRLRDAINKNITEQDIFDSLSQAFSVGYSAIKLYFMMGLPTETEQDIEGISLLTEQIRKLYQSVRGKRDLKLSLSVATFIPKPFTPFQWEAFADRADIDAKQAILKEKLRGKHVSFAYHDYEASFLEAVFARGDRRLGRVLKLAYEYGAKFDGWSELFRPELYFRAAEETGTDLKDFVRLRDVTETLPWDFVDVGITKEFLKKEKEKAYRAETTYSCSKRCNLCGLEKEGVCR